MDVLAIFNSVWIQNKLSWSYDGGSCQSNKKYFLTVNNMPNKLGSFEALIYLTIILGTPNKEQNGTNGGATFFKKSWRDPLQVVNFPPTNCRKYFGPPQKIDTINLLIQKHQILGNFQVSVDSLCVFFTAFFGNLKSRNAKCRFEALRVFFWKNWRK